MVGAWTPFYFFTGALLQASPSVAVGGGDALFIVVGVLAAMVVGAWVYHCGQLGRSPMPRVSLPRIGKTAAKSSEEKPAERRPMPRV
jgi:hypothetical protein